MSQISRLRDAEISNGNLINANDIDIEFNQLVAESNGQDNRLTSLESSAMTIGGVKTFSSAPRADQIDERTSAAGVTIDSVLHKDGAIRLSPVSGYTPVSNGDFGYDSTTHTYKAMENGAIRTVNMAAMFTVSKSSAYTALTGDKGGLFLCTSTWTLSLTAAATLGNGWLAFLRNDGTGIITIDPNGAETIDGVATLTVYPGETLTIICDGSAFRSVGRARGWIPLASLTASASATLDFTSYINSDFTVYKFIFEQLVPATNGTQCWIRFSQNAGSSWDATGGNYAWSTSCSDGGMGGSASTSDTKIDINSSSLGTTNLSSTYGFSGEATLYYPQGTNYRFITGQLGYLSSYPRAVSNAFNGIYKTAAAITGVRFVMASGNITSGTVRMLGWRQG